MIKKIKRLSSNINSLKTFLGRELFYKSIKSRSDFEVVDSLNYKKILVLVPHPDDEVIGLGGTLQKLVKSGAQIKLIYFSDGSGGFPDGFRPTTAEKAQMVKTRQSEANSAAKVLGLEDLTFLKYIDGKFEANETVVKYLKQLISTFEPDLVFAPSFLDTHSDHIEVAAALYKALRSGYKCDIYSYEVWSPIYANKIVKIDTEFAKKAEALSEYKSQLKSRNFIEAIKGLNAYRAGMYNAGRYGEGFFALSSQLYLKFFSIY